MKRRTDNPSQYAVPREGEAPAEPCLGIDRLSPFAARREARPPTKAAEPQAFPGRAKLPLSRALVPARSGFSLIELLVVISIIVIIIAIGFGVMVSFYQGAAERTTNMVLQTMLSVDTEFKVATGQSVPADPPFPGGVNVNPGVNNIGEYLAIVRALPTCRAILETLPNEVVSREGDDIIEVRDGWDTPIRYIYIDESLGDDTDYLANNHRPYFGSAGPDTQWGGHQSGVTPAAQEKRRLANDNIYSFQMD